MHRAVLLAEGSDITPEAITLDDDPQLYRQRDIAARVVDQAETITRALVGKTVSDVEQGLILDTLDHCLGNRTQAARILGISIRTLRNKLNEYAARGIEISDGHKSQMIA